MTLTDTESPATVSDVYAYFADSHVDTETGKKVNNGYTLSQFNTHWKRLTDKDKLDLKAGIGDGTLNY